MKSREPSSLDLFLLALIDSGLSTPYEFQRQAGISVGASLPALKTLLQRKLVARGEEADRRRREYSLTSRGRNALKAVRLNSPEDPSDLQSAFRFAVLARHSKSRSAGTKVLKRMLKRLTTGEDESFEACNLSSPASAYKWMVSVRQRHRRDADIQTLKKILRDLGRQSR